MSQAPGAPRLRPTERAWRRGEVVVSHFGIVGDGHAHLSSDIHGFHVERNSLVGAEGRSAVWCEIDFVIPANSAPPTKIGQTTPDAVLESRTSQQFLAYEERLGHVLVFLHGIFSNSRTCWTAETTSGRTYWPDLDPDRPQNREPVHLHERVSHGHRFRRLRLARLRG